MSDSNSASNRAKKDSHDGFLSDGRTAHDAKPSDFILGPKGTNCKCCFVRCIYQSNLKLDMMQTP